MLIGGVAALALLLVPPAFAAPRGGKPSGAVKRFTVHGVYTREQRSMLVAEGYDIGEAAWADHVELYGTQRQARALSLRGFRVVERAQRVGKPAQINDFPPEDSNYHNYAEMVADLQALAAAHPQMCTSSRSGLRTKDGISSACASRTTRTTTCPSRASSSSASITHAST